MKTIPIKLGIVYKIFKIFYSALFERHTISFLSCFNTAISTILHHKIKVDIVNVGIFLFNLNIFPIKLHKISFKNFFLLKL